MPPGHGNRLCFLMLARYFTRYRQIAPRIVLRVDPRISVRVGLISQASSPAELLAALAGLPAEAAFSSVLIRSRSLSMLRSKAALLFQSAWFTAGNALVYMPGFSNDFETPDFAVTIT